MTNVINFADFQPINNKTGEYIEYDQNVIVAAIFCISAEMEYEEPDSLTCEIYSKLMSKGALFNEVVDEDGSIWKSLKKDKIRHILNVLIEYEIDCLNMEVDCDL